MTQLRITIKNTSDTGGTFLTPVWFGFHDGSFDLFDTGTAASAGLEALAEDGNAAGLGAELIDADGDAQGGIVAGAAGPIATNEVTSQVVDVDGASNGSVSLAAMLLPSNDAFIGTGEAVTLFNGSGRFLGEQTITFAGGDVYDAGTEVNTELDAAFINQTAPNTGIDQNGVVAQHPGFNGSVGNPEGEGDQIILGGTNAFGVAIDPNEADFTRPGSQVAEVHINTVRFRDGTDGRDFIRGRRDDDIIDAGDGRDVVFGGRGWDVIDGGAGRDHLFGGRGDDQINGGAGRDWVAGGSGDDILGGGTGRDHLIGGRGDDTFVFTGGDGHDRILDFGRGHDDDRIALSVEGVGTFEDVLAHADQSRRGVELDFGDDGSVFLSGVRLSSLDADDFLFV